MQSSTKENWVNWVNGVKENGANFQPKDMPNYLEGGSEGSLANDYKIQSEIQTDTNEDLKFTFTFII